MAITVTGRTKTYPLGATSGNTTTMLVADLADLATGVSSVAPVDGDIIFATWTSTSTQSDANISLPTGWTKAFTEINAGTLPVRVHYHKYVTGENGWVWTNSGGTTGTSYGRMWWVHGADITKMIIGTFNTRATSGTSFTNIAVAATSVDPDSVAMALSWERTLAAETTSQLTVSGTGWTKSFDDISPGVSGGTFDQTMCVALKSMPTAGTTGAVTFTYPNTQGTNGVSGQIILSPLAVVDPGPTDPTKVPVIKGTSWIASTVGLYNTYVSAQTGWTLSGSAIATGDWMVALFASNGAVSSTGTITPPSGWVQWKGPTDVATMGYMAFLGVRQPGDTFYQFLASGSTPGMGCTVIWGSGADPDISHWIKGAFTNRADLVDSGKAFLARAVSATAIKDNSLALFAAVERSAATESDLTFPKFSTAGTTKNLFANVTDGTNSVLFGSRGIKDGVVPSETITYQNSHTDDGVAAMLLIPPAPGGVPASGVVRSALAANFGQTTLQIGVVANQGTTFRAKVGSNYFTGTISGHYYATAQITGLTAGTSYTVEFEIGGTLQTDYTVTVKTLPAAGTPVSFKALAGSCQKTGSNHASIARMATEGAVFFAHMGDIHYGDATTEVAWQSAMETSLTSANMKTLMASTPMDYIWDNHDRIIVPNAGETTGLNLGTTDPATLSVWRELAGTNFPATDAQYRTWVVGRVRFIHTDAWSVRDDPDLVSEPRTMFGAAQKAWLKATWLAATEPLIVWFCSFPNHNVGNGRWNSFNAEVAELTAWLAARPSVRERLVMIGGDSHDLRADSGKRRFGTDADIFGGPHNFIGVPSLNVSGIDQGSDTPWVTYNWDIAEGLTGNNSGSYSRITVTDAGGGSLTFLWEAVNGTTGGILAQYRRRISVIELGSGVQGALSYYDSSRQQMIPMGLQVIPSGPQGFGTVTNMMAQTEIKVAHRGGSYDYPEMSRLAYDQSVLKGYKALEVSVARSSDGQIFGLHDASLDRTSLNTGGGSGTTYVASAMTWADIQTHTILGAMAAHDPTQAAQPYMLLSDVVAAYPSHVFFIDAKNITNTAQINSLLDWMDAHGGTERFVAKYFGVVNDTTSWMGLAKARGYVTWGYFYAADSANYAVYAAKWTLLGMDYTADQASWTALAAAGPGKRILGHIIPNAAGVTTARTKGTTAFAAGTAAKMGYMISGTKDIPPVE